MWFNLVMTTTPITNRAYKAALAAHPQTFTERDSDTGQITGIYTIDEGRKVYVSRWIAQ